MLPSSLAVMTLAKPVVLGLTGGIAMGKSTASSWLRRAGFRIHDADACVHCLYGPGGSAVAAVVAVFPSALGPDGGIDRAALSAAVVAAGREASLKQLETIVHPLVTAERDAFLQRAHADGEWLVGLDIPLLFETMDEAARSKLIDAVAVVSAPAATQRARCLGRPGMTAEKLDAILKRQAPDEQKRAKADYVIETGDGLSPARAQLAQCVTSLAAAHAPRYAAWRDGAAADAAAGAAAGAAADAVAEGGMDLGGISAITFDLDDTLWPTMPPILAAGDVLVEAVAELLPGVAAAGLAERGSLRAAMGPAADKQPLIAYDMTAIRRASLEALAVAHGDDVAKVDEVIDRFLNARSDVRSHFFGDAAPTIEALRARGFKVGALTNGNCDVSRHGAVGSLFDFAVTAADAGAAKPSAAPFWHAAAAAGCHPRSMLHVGDAVDADLCGALAAGYRAVLLTRDGAPSRPAAEPPLVRGRQA